MSAAVLAVDKIGHYGCGAGEGALVRLGPAEAAKRPPETVEISACPACCDPHRARSAHWRNPTDLDAGREPQALVDAEGRQVR